MCLDRVDKTYDIQDNNRVVEGFQVKEVTVYERKTFYRGFYSDWLRGGRWLQCRKSHTNFDNYYPGFHIFNSIHAARQYRGLIGYSYWKIIKVKGRGVIAEGTQSLHQNKQGKVFVCREMIIKGEVI